MVTIYEKFSPELIPQFDSSKNSLGEFLHFEGGCALRELDEGAGNLRYRHVHHYIHGNVFK
jgi:hypothetical protein